MRIGGSRGIGTKILANRTVINLYINTYGFAGIDGNVIELFIPISIRSSYICKPAQVIAHSLYRLPMQARESGAGAYLSMALNA